MTLELVESLRHTELFGVITLDQVMIGMALGAVVRWIFDLDIGLGTAAVLGVAGIALEPALANALGAAGPGVVSVNVLFATAAVLVASGILQVFQR